MIISKLLKFTGLTVIAFALTVLPINASSDYYHVDEDEMQAYLYWFNQGLSNEISSDTETANLHLSQSTSKTTHNYYKIYCNDAYPSNASDNTMYCRFLTSSDSAVSPTDNTTYYASNNTLTLPGTKFSATTGTFTGIVNPTSYNLVKSVDILAGVDYYIYFWCDYSLVTDNVTTYNNNNATIIHEVTTDGNRTGYFRRYCAKFRSNIDTRMSVNWGRVSTDAQIRPIFNGTLDQMSDNMRSKLNIDTRVLEVLKGGNSQTHDSINANTSIRNDLNNQNSEMHQMESTFNNDMNTALDNIDTNNTIINNNKFISSAMWVRRRFDELIMGTPFELILVFSLILGIALTVVGKIRG